MHRVAVVAVPPVTPFDLSIPELVLGGVVVDGQPGYDVRVCTAEPGPVAGYGTLDVVVSHGLDVVAASDTVIVTGTGSREETDPAVLTALREAAAAGERIASICTGAFVLAQAGLLEGRAATTYWAKTAEFRRRHPTVDLGPDVLFVEDGPILTSAGLSAGIDLCLHLVRTDYGTATANAIAWHVVAAPVRPGGQAQFIESPLPPERGVFLAGTRTWAPRTPGCAVDPRGSGRARQYQRAHTHTALPRGDRRQPVAVAPAPTPRPCTGVAGVDRPVRG